MKGVAYQLVNKLLGFIKEYKRHQCWLSVSLSVQEGCSQLHQRGSIIEVINTCTWEDTVGQFIILWTNLLSKLKDAPSLLEELSSINYFCFSVLIWKGIFYYIEILKYSIQFNKF